MPYFPTKTSKWRKLCAAESGFDTDRLDKLIQSIDKFESSWPYNLELAKNLPGLTEFEQAPYNEVLGPLKPRGRNNGCVLKNGMIVEKWGDVERVDMTFSIAKSYLAVLTGIAIGDGLIKNVDTLVSDTITLDEFNSEQNMRITWRHLLEQTSEWEGTLWEKPDLIDRNRQLGPQADNSRKGQHRDLNPAGTFYEYNDVRVNLLALCLLYTFKRPLPEILKERIMDPIGASEKWVWHGYKNSFVEIDNQILQSVPGGTHWGGGIQISTMDHARFSLLIHNRGVWNGKRLLPEDWCDQLRKPSRLNANYGFLWWLNTNGNKWVGCPNNSYGAIGAGSNIIWINPDTDVIVVARWIEDSKVSQLLKEIVLAQI